MNPPDTFLSILGQRLRIRCEDVLFSRLVLANYTAFRACEGLWDVDYVVRRPSGGGFCISRGDDVVVEVLSETSVQYAFLYALEKTIAMDLQYARPDLYFVHAAVLERRGRCVLLVAASGTGKSTTAWALLQYGFCYMSDELAPIDPSGRVIHPYPHALCLKSEPPAPFQLPQETVRTERTVHVPVESLPTPIIKDSRPLHSIFFLQRDTMQSHPWAQPLSKAQASTRLYANTLNALAHPNGGIDVAINIASTVPTFLLNIGELHTTCELIAQLADTAA